MKLLKILITGILVLGIISGCRKKEKNLPEDEEPAFSYPGYSRLIKGSYWIYQYYLIIDKDTTSYSQFDSCYVSSDTLIHGARFFKYFDGINQGSKTRFVRDSLHYIVDSEKGIIFSSQDFTSIFKTWYAVDTTNNKSDTIFKANLRMADKDRSIFLPAGTFETCDALSTFTLYPTHFAPGTPNPGYAHARYAKNIGMVYESFFSGTDIITGRKLVRYGKH